MGVRDEAFKSLLDRPAKVGPKWEPKVSIRVTDERTTQVLEYAIPVPKEGASPESFEKAMTSLMTVFRKLGYL